MLPRLWSRPWQLTSPEETDWLSPVVPKAGHSGPGEALGASALPETTGIGWQHQAWWRQMAGATGPNASHSTGCSGISHQGRRRLAAGNSQDFGL